MTGHVQRVLASEFEQPRPGQRDGTASGPAWGSPDSSTRSPQNATVGRPAPRPRGRGRCGPRPSRTSRTSSDAAGQLETPGAPHVVPGSAPRVSAASSAARASSPAPYRVRVQLLAPVLVHLGRAARDEDLRARERRRAEDMVEWGVGEREEVHTAAGERLRLPRNRAPSARLDPASTISARPRPRPVRPCSPRRKPPPTPRCQLSPTPPSPHHLIRRRSREGVDATAFGGRDGVTSRDTSVYVRAPCTRSRDRPCRGRTHRPYTGPGNAGTRTR